MCGRFSLLSSKEEIEDKFNVSLEAVDYQLRLNIAPHQGILAFTLDKEGEFSPKLLYWGFIPAWIKDIKTAYKPINARAENLQKNAYFRHAFKHGRCLIPANSFYEWDQHTQPKTPYSFFLPQHQLFAFVGLWNTWQDAEGNLLDTGTIITTQANDRIRWIHDRMPVILYEADWRLWLENKRNEFDILANNTLEFARVSSAINNPRYSG